MVEPPIFAGPDSHCACSGTNTVAQDGAALYAISRGARASETAWVQIDAITGNHLGADDNADL
jgi:hypothetical protein